MNEGTALKKEPALNVEIMRQRNNLDSLCNAVCRLESRAREIVGPLPSDGNVKGDTISAGVSPKTSHVFNLAENNGEMESLTRRIQEVLEVL